MKAQRLKKYGFKGLIERHFQMISLDPYANAFNETSNGAGHQDDQTTMHPMIWGT